MTQNSDYELSSFMVDFERQQAEEERRRNEEEQERRRKEEEEERREMELVREYEARLEREKRIEEDRRREEEQRRELELTREQEARLEQERRMEDQRRREEEEQLIQSTQGSYHSFNSSQHSNSFYTAGYQSSQFTNDLDSTINNNSSQGSNWNGYESTQ